MQYVQLLIEFLNESNSIINQVTNTATVTYSSATVTLKYYRSYNVSGFVCWPTPITQNGIGTCY